MPTTRDALRDFIATEWPRVVADAGFDLESVAYWISEDTPPEIRDRTATYFFRGQDLELEPSPLAFSKEQLAEASSPSFCDRHRIIVHLDYDFPKEMSQKATEGFFASVMRHELEHARQAETLGGRAALEIDRNLVKDVLSRKAGGIKGAGALYNCKPIEMDANAAAAVYARKHHPSAVDELLEYEVGSFVRSNTGPESLESLLRRTVCFLFQFCSIADELYADGVPVEGRLRFLGGDEAADLWTHLVSLDSP